MLRPRKMKMIELLVLKSDMNAVLDFLGRRGVMQFPASYKPVNTDEAANIVKIIDRLYSCAKFIGIKPENIEIKVENESIPVLAEEDKTITEKICSVVEKLKESQIKLEQEKRGVEETLNEARAFSKLNVPFSELEHLSYLTLRIGRIDSKNQGELRENLGNKAVIINLDKDQILAATSRKGRFAMDTQLKKASFEPAALPQDYSGVPSEMLTGLEEQLARYEEEIKSINDKKEILRKENSSVIERLVSSWNIVLAIEEIKSGFAETESTYNFSGWMPADFASKITKELIELTGGRTAIHSYSPNEVPSIADGSEKVPVYLKHGTFVKGFQTIVLSYGAPLYGSIDPTPFVAFFYTILFGIMFGDVGQGFVLFCAGLLILKGPKKLAKFSHFSIPLISVGIASMIMGFLCGSVFTSESLLITPTRAVTSFITGQPMDRILYILPLEEAGGSLRRLLFFFAFTIGVGIIVNSTGLIINIYNRCISKNYEKAFFSRTGLAGLVFFWYVIFIALRIIFGGSFELFDIAALLLLILVISLSPALWRIIAREKPILEHGLMTFIMEAFVEILETVSGYLSNTVSFLRVGAFALLHAVLSFIIFTFTEMLMHSGGVSGSFFAILLLIAGNSIIIVLEGMIVAIQVMRLQYYEFFNKFFVETGVEFAPFRFKIRKT